MASSASTRAASVQPTGPDDVRLPRVGRPVSATARVPGSKSLANRALLVAAMADGASDLTNVPDSDDVWAMIECLRRLGASLQLHGPARGPSAVDGGAPGGPRAPLRIGVHGLGGRWPNTDATLPAGDAGTVMRFMTAAACLGHGDYYVDGSEQLRRRPMRGLVDALQTLGAQIEFEDRDGHVPLTVHASGLRGGTVTFVAPESSQFVSALMLVAVHARSDVFIAAEGPLRSRPFVEMTLRVMRQFGAEIVTDQEPRWVVAAGQRYRATTLHIEPDATNASYFFGLAALTGGRIGVADLGDGSRQGDLRMLEIRSDMGCTVEHGPQRMVAVAGPANGRLRGVDVDLSGSPDLAPTLAVLGLFADGPTRLHGVPHLRLKESDRVMSIAHNVEKLGGRVDVHEDGIAIHPAEAPVGGVINPFGDHRIAMAFTLASARLDGMVISGGSCVTKSFPGFFDEWRRVTA